MSEATVLARSPLGAHWIDRTSHGQTSNERFVFFQDPQGRIKYASGGGSGVSSTVLEASEAPFNNQFAILGWGWHSADVNTHQHHPELCSSQAKRNSRGAFTISQGPVISRRYLIFLHPFSEPPAHRKQVLTVPYPYSVLRSPHQAPQTELHGARANSADSRLLSILTWGQFDTMSTQTPMLYNSMSFTKTRIPTRSAKSSRRTRTRGKAEVPNSQLVSKAQALP